jgi:hypothetical protein
MKDDVLENVPDDQPTPSEACELCDLLPHLRKSLSGDAYALVHARFVEGRTLDEIGAALPGLSRCSSRAGHRWERLMPDLRRLLSKWRPEGYREDLSDQT